MTGEEEFVFALLLAAAKRSYSDEEHTRYWYGVRHRNITELFQNHALWPEYACIMANGSTEGYPPTYAQMLNTAIYRAEKAERDLEKERQKNIALTKDIK